jgi:RNA polymerase sigma-70 factor (ECF subfamily)
MPFDDSRLAGSPASDPSPSEPAPSARSEALVTALSAAGVARSHEGLVRGTLLRLGVPSQDVEDVAQDVLAVVVKKLATFSVEPPLSVKDALRLWLRSICVVCAREHERNRRKHAGLVPLDGAAESMPWLGGRADRQIELQEDVRRLVQLVAALAPPLRAVWLAREIEGRTMPEIARDLGIPVGTAWNRLRLAREQLHASMRSRPARERRRLLPLLFPFASEERSTRAVVWGAGIASVEACALLFAVAAAIAWLPVSPPDLPLVPDARAVELPVRAGAVLPARISTSSHAAAAPSFTALPSATVAPSVTAPPSATAAAPPVAAPSVAQTQANRSERVYFSLAREALVSCRPGEAKSILARHQRAFPNSHFAAERAALARRAEDRCSR